MPEATIYSASWLVSPHAAPLSGGAILVCDGVITAMGSLKELRRDHAAASVVDYPGCAILPGFVNAHTHLELSHFSAWRLRTHVDYNPRSFVDWIIQLIKIKRGLKAEDYVASVNGGMRMCLEAGTTAVGEIVGNPSLASLYRTSLLSGRLFVELFGHDPATFHSLLDHAVETGSVGMSANFAAGLSPHATYTISDENLLLIREIALSHNLPLSIHISESPAETDFIFDSSGPLAEMLYPFVNWERYLMPPRRYSSTQLLDRVGLLTASTLAIHCVHVTLADALILKERGVSVALCPRSNDCLDVGRAPVAMLKKLRIPLALGTDSLASNDSLSLWDEMRFAMDTFPQELSPLDVFQMVTSNAAAALGISSTSGSLEPVKRADFQVVGDVGDVAEKVLERAISKGQLHEVYAAGRRYTGMAN
ncbi:MAG: amidohydrolase family protein [Pedobacter sp.]